MVAQQKGGGLALGGTQERAEGGQLLRADIYRLF